jgi:hypothetical protein
MDKYYPFGTLIAYPLWRMEEKTKMAEKVITRAAHACLWTLASMTLSLAIFLVAHMIGLV